MRVLEVHAEPGNGRLGDEHPELAVLERLQRLRFVLWRLRPFDHDGPWDRTEQGLALGVQPVPYDPLVPVTVDKCGSLGNPAFRCDAAYRSPIRNALEPCKEQLPIGNVGRFYKLRSD